MKVVSGLAKLRLESIDRMRKLNFGDETIPIGYHPDGERLLSEALVGRCLYSVNTGNYTEMGYYLENCADFCVVNDDSL